MVVRNRNWVLAVVGQPSLSAVLGLIVVASLGAAVVVRLCSAQVAFVSDQLAGLESIEERPAHCGTEENADIAKRH